MVVRVIWVMPMGIEQPEQKAAHNDIPNDFLYEMGEKEKSQNDDNDTGNAIAPQCT